MIAVLVVMAIGEFLVVALTQGDFDAAKHLLLFRAIVDVLLIVAFIAVIALIRSRRNSTRPLKDRATAVS